MERWPTLKLLLDTHIWLWSINRTERLTRTVRREIANPRNELFISPISIWEARHMANRGKLKIDHFPTWLDEALNALLISEAPINFAVAAQAAALRLPQHDIGDVFLAATASVFGMTLVTSDEQLIASSAVQTLANI